MAGVQDDHDVGLLLRHLGDQQAQLLVRQVPAAVRAAVVADDGLVQVIRLQVPELGRRLLLRAVAAVVEQRHVVRAGLAEVVAEAVDHRLAGGLDLVGVLAVARGQDAGLQLELATLGAQLQELRHALDVVDAAVEAGHAAEVVVDADE